VGYGNGALRAGILVQQSLKPAVSLLTIVPLSVSGSGTTSYKVETNYLSGLRPHQLHADNGTAEADAPPSTSWERVARDSGETPYLSPAALKKKRLD
jgi:hypothetical protein